MNCKSLVKLLSCRAKLNKCDIHQKIKWTCLHIHCHAPNHIQALFFISYSSAVLLSLSLLQLIIKAPNVYVIGKINISIYPEAPLFQGHSSTGEIWRRRRRRPRREGRTPGHSRRVRGVTGGPVRTRSFGSSLRSTGRRTGTPLPRSWRGDQVGFPVPQFLRFLFLRFLKHQHLKQNWSSHTMSCSAVLVLVCYRTWVVLAR